MGGMFTELKRLDGEAKVKEPVAAVKKQVPPLLQQTVETSNCQLNAWITAGQNQQLNVAYSKLIANGMKVKKGHLVGLAIEVVSRILENQLPSTLDISILDSYMVQKQKT